MPSPRRNIEAFHLLFLSHFGRHADKALYAVKGGCNLRFFFGSSRYSEDLDIDVKTIAPNTLRDKVNKIVASAPFVRNLAVKNMAVTRSTEPKQTDTVQRWKIEIRSGESSVPLHTKIEFSRRGIAEGAEIAPVSRHVISAHDLPTILLSHYNKDAACLQKVAAIIGRSEIQTRDIFDLKLLIEAGARPRITPALRRDLDKARVNVNASSLSDFKGQVFAFLEPEQQDYWRDGRVWKETVAMVIAKLEEWA